MTRTQKSIFLAVAVFIALTRFLAVARSMFDWDEALFTLGVRDYEVPQHHPHPPGYPLFIAAAKAFHLLGIPEFRALQVVVVLGAIFLFPALFFLARQLGFDFATSVGGAAIFAFLPNVWIYGGTGFSDVPATAIGFAACALLLRGRYDARAYVLGAILLGVAAGFRPPNLLLGLVPALIATWHQRRSLKHVALAILLGGAIAAGSYVGAALASSTVDNYIFSVRAQSKWVRDVDSFRNPNRAPLREMAKIFFVRPIKQGEQMRWLTILAAISLLAAIVQRRAAPFLTLALFAPFAIVAWLNLDFETASRYAIAYMAAHALLVADTLGVFAVRRAKIQAVLCAMVIAVFAVWTWPALRLQRTSEAPPAAALEWVKRNLPKNAKVFIHSGIAPHIQAILPDHNTTWYDTPDQISLLAGDAWIVDLRTVPNAHNFTWPHTNPLWRIVRQRNFESSVSRASSRIVFGEGWWGDEGAFQWMKGEAVASLPSFRGNGKLRIAMYVPIDTLPAPPAIEVWMNGALLERFTGAQPTIEKTWIVPSRADAPNQLRIKTSATVNPARLGRSGDSRDLGLRIDALTWSPQ